GAFWWSRRAAASSAESPKEAKPAKRGLVSFEPFVVNLADKEAPRFLRTTVGLVVDDAEAEEHVKESHVQVLQARSAILELLSAQTSEVLATADGKAALKQAIIERLHTTFSGMKVEDVLFSDFVIQY